LCGLVRQRVSAADHTPTGGTVHSIAERPRRMRSQTTRRRLPAQTATKRGLR
jgi:hypothetical protein